VNLLSVAYVRENRSFAPLGLTGFPVLLPTAYAVGCILSPLRGLGIGPLTASEL